MGIGGMHAQVLSKPEALILPNEGQWPSEVLAMVNVDAARVWILADGLRFVARMPGEGDSVVVWTERYLNSSGGQLEIQGSGPPTAFALGRKPLVAVRGSSQAWLRGIYPGVDLELRVEGGRLKTWWQGEDLSPILIHFEGCAGRRQRRHPEVLELQTPAGVAELWAPVAYARDGSPVPVQWQQSGENWGFKAPGAQRIDPTYVFSSFSGSLSDNFGYTATYDLQGRTWLGGVSFCLLYTSPSPRD